MSIPYSPTSPGRSTVSTMSNDSLPRLPSISKAFPELAHSAHQLPGHPTSPPITPDADRPSYLSTSPGKRKRDDDPLGSSDLWHKIKRASVDSTPSHLFAPPRYARDTPSSLDSAKMSSIQDSSHYQASAPPKTGFAVAASHQLPGLRNALGSSLGTASHAPSMTKNHSDPMPYMRPEGRPLGDYRASTTGDESRGHQPPRLPPIHTAACLNGRDMHPNSAHATYASGMDQWSAASRPYDERAWERRVEDGYARPCPICESRGARWLHECPHVQPRSAFSRPLGPPAYSSPHHDFRRPSLGYEARNYGGSSHYQWENPGMPNDAVNRRRRGNLPKESTAVLNSWFCSHINYPYPKEEEKQRLQHETGLTMAQISNWFINARRRRRPGPAIKDDKSPM